MRNIPRLRFAHLPTPVETLPRLSSNLGGPRIMIKRDDQTGLAFGGNKTRKLEFLLAEAQANGARTLITAGAMQSNHCRQTAAAAARNGYDCILVLTDATISTKIPADFEGVRKNSQTDQGTLKELSGNLLLDVLFGAEIVWSPNNQRDQFLQHTFEKAWEDGRRPYLIPYGGSNATGAAAYTMALRELLDQCNKFPLEGDQPDWILVPSSSGGTQAGLVLGARLFGYEGSILGISIDEPENSLQNRVALLAEQASEYLADKRTFSAKEILVNADYLGDGYGVLGEGERKAVRLFASLEGILLDPVYTGRAAAGLFDLIDKRFFTKDETVLFWHTGGTPAIFAQRYRDLVE